MGTLTIDNKKFVVIEQKKFDKIQLLATQKSSPVKKLTLAAGKKHAYKLIDTWQKESKYPRTCSDSRCRNSMVY